MPPSPKICPVCREDFRTSQKRVDYYESKRLYQLHLRSNHPDYVRWSNRTSWGYFIALALFLGFPIVGYASRSRDTANLFLILSWVSLLTVTTATLVLKNRGAKRFRETWEEGHPLGN